MKIESTMDAYGFPILTASALKRARKLLNWRVADLVQKTHGAVSDSAIHAFEAESTSYLRTLTNREIVAALQKAGIEFVPRRSRAEPAPAHAV
jgi:hypothetical protein